MSDEGHASDAELRATAEIEMASGYDYAEDWLRVLDRAVAAESALRAQAAQTEGLRELAEWLVAMDNPEDVLALEERRAVTLTRIIVRARAALSAAPAPGLVLTTGQVAQIDACLQGWRDWIDGHDGDTAATIAELDACLSLLARTSETP